MFLGLQALNPVLQKLYAGRARFLRVKLGAAQWTVFDSRNKFAFVISPGYLWCVKGRLRIYLQIVRCKRMHKIKFLIFNAREKSAVFCRCHIVPAHMRQNRGIELGDLTWPLP